MIFYSSTQFILLRKMKLINHHVISTDTYQFHPTCISFHFEMVIQLIFHVMRFKKLFYFLSSESK